MLMVIHWSYLLLMLLEPLLLTQFFKRLKYDSLLNPIDGEFIRGSFQSGNSFL